MSKPPRCSCKTGLLCGGRHRQPCRATATVEQRLIKPGYVGLWIPYCTACAAKLQAYPEIVETRTFVPYDSGTQ